MVDRSNESRRNLLLHTATNATSTFVPMLVTLIILPDFVSTVGDSRYGVLVIVWIATSYLGLFELGLGKALSVALPKVHDNISRSNLVADACVGSLALTIPLCCLIQVLVELGFSGSLGSSTGKVAEELPNAIAVAALTLPVSALSSVLAGSLQASLAFGYVGLTQAVGAVLQQLIPYATARFGEHSLGALTAGVLAAKLLVLFVLAVGASRKFDATPWRLRLTSLRDLVTTGSWITLSSIISPLMVIADRFLIARTSGPEEVTRYALPYQLVEKTQVVAISFSSAILPRLAEGRRLEVSSRWYYIGISLLFGTVVSLIGVCLELWLGNVRAAKSINIAYALVVGYWLNSLAILPYTHLLAKGRAKQIAMAHLAEVLPYFAILYMLSSRFGAEGAAVAFCLRTGADLCILLRLSDQVQSNLIWIPPVMVVPLTGLFVFGIGL